MNNYLNYTKFNQLLQDIEVSNSHFTTAIYPPGI